VSDPGGVTANLGQVQNGTIGALSTSPQHIAAHARVGARRVPFPSFRLRYVISPDPGTQRAVSPEGRRALRVLWFGSRRNPSFVRAAGHERHDELVCRL